MKKKNLIKIITIVGFLALVFTVGLYYLISSHSKSNITTNAVADKLFGWKYPSVKFPMTGSGNLAYSDIRDPGGIPQGLPVRLQIPVIGVDSAIEDALVTPDGRMDVPSGSVDVAWFALGPHPGQVGSAVIGGHFGIQNGVPFVFYKLDELAVGDKVYVVDDKGDTLAFVVRAIKLFDRDADATTVFTSNDGLAHLNLITCEGIWNQVNGNYPQRRVVFADALASEESIVPKAQAVDTFPRTLDLGTSGVDVAALQTILEQKGFLMMPRGVAKGFFGAATRGAISKYQTTVGLSSVGVFGPLTKARLLVDLANNPVLPNTGEALVAPIPVSPEGHMGPINVVNSPLTSLQIFIRSSKDLYATPTDALITLFLILAIVFVAFKIIRR